MATVAIPMVRRNNELKKLIIFFAQCSAWYLRPSKPDWIWESENEVTKSDCDGSYCSAISHVIVWDIWWSVKTILIKSFGLIEKHLNKAKVEFFSFFTIFFTMNKGKYNIKMNASYFFLSRQLCLRFKF
jgi:hypothetical protein